MFSLQKNWRGGWNRFCLEVEQKMCTHVSEYKNDKIKGENQKRID
jgi:hypothetical protein